MKKVRNRMFKILGTTLMLLGIMAVCNIPAQAASGKLQSLCVVVPAEGFNPSAGNYITIKANTSSNVTNQSLRIRIVDASGRYVYQKTFKKINKNAYFSFNWNGKASKNNKAGLPSGQYIPDGQYEVQGLLFYDYGGTRHYSKKLKALKVSRYATAGKAALAKRELIPMLTGDREVDWVAEQMIHYSGMQPYMSTAQKVKAIYRWMTYRFHHVHYSMSKTYTRYYNVPGSTAKITAYKRQTNALASKGQLVYNYYSPYHVLWNMERRIGQCNNHAYIFKILCNHIGVEADVHHGLYLNRNGSRVGHYWNSAVIDGTRYYFDVDVEIQNMDNKSLGGYYWFMKTRKEAEQNHLFYD